MAKQTKGTHPEWKCWMGMHKLEMGKCVTCGRSETYSIYSMVLAAVAFILIAVTLMGLIYLMMGSRVGGSASLDCSFDQIELKNVSPYRCYRDFAPDYCPVPKSIHCKGDMAGSLPAYLVGRLSS